MVAGASQTSRVLCTLSRYIDPLQGVRVSGDCRFIGRYHSENRPTHQLLRCTFVHTGRFTAFLFSLFEVLHAWCPASAFQIDYKAICLRLGAPPKRSNLGPGEVYRQFTLRFAKSRLPAFWRALQNLKAPRGPI